MNVTRNVILDLLPLYFAGQVSDDTKSLVDEFLQRDPDFARMSARFDTLVKKRGAVGASADAERRALQRTRKLLGLRNQTIGMAAGYTLAPFFFFFRDGRIEWVLWERRPAIALAFAATAAVCWVAAFVINRRTKRAQV